MAGINEIRESFEKHLHHPYGSEFVQLPALSDRKIDQLWSVVEHSSLPKSKKVNIICALLLMELATSLHDEMNRTNLRSTELHVLMSDLYSSKYYDLFAQNDEFSLLSKTSAGIATMNELKLKLRNTSMEIEQTMQCIGDIAFAIFAPYFQTFGTVEQSLIFKRLLMVEYIEREVELFLQQRPTHFLVISNDEQVVAIKQKLRDVTIA
ncbi:MAG: heptaprenyl diphosphate synthase component 1 [Bacilli bacterium]